MPLSPSARFAVLPSIDRLLQDDETRALIEAFGRDAVKLAAQSVLAALRSELKRAAADDDAKAIDNAFIVSRIAATLASENRHRLRPVFNLTGTLIHTNLGRAVLPDVVIEAVVTTMGRPVNLEYDLGSGRRGDRDTHLEQQLCRLTGAEAATVVNNNAAAVMLVLNTLGLGRETLVSRGELVEIGGSFRMPDIITRAGCRLVEVGTTNRTHRQDYANAIGDHTALLLKVHQSNYVIDGFTTAVSTAELSTLAKHYQIPLVVDLGSGALVDLDRYDLPRETTPMDELGYGADLVTFSGDKLLGGPQAGLIVGSRTLIDSINANPMKRALRCNKMTVAALSALFDLYRHPAQLPRSLPALRQLLRTTDELHALALRLQPLIAQPLQGKATVDVSPCESVIGSGALPTRTVPSVALALRRTDTGHSLDSLAAHLRRLSIPVIGRIHHDALFLDLRSLEAEDAFIGQLSELAD